MTMKKSLLKILAFLIAASLLLVGVSSCTTEVEVEVIKEVEVEVPMDLAETAAAILAGQIEGVPSEAGLARTHIIHPVVLGLDCNTCHILTADLSPKELTTQQEIFYAQDVSPDAPAPVDRTACLACHRTAGPGKFFFGSEE